MSVPFPEYGFAGIDVNPDLGISSERGADGLIVTSRSSDPYWAGTLTTGTLEVAGPNQHADFRAFLSRCVDMNLRVDFLHPRHLFPDGYDATSWPLVADPVLVSLTDLRNIVVSGLSIGMVLPRGTRLSLVQGDGDAQVVCHRWLGASVTVSDEDTQSIEVTPRLPLGIFSAGAAVAFKNPVMRFAVVPNTWNTAEVPDSSSISFDVAEALR